MVISGGTALGKDDINQMIKDAEAHAEEDRQKREEAETRNTADTLAWQTENLLKEQGDKVPADDREKIDVALKNLKETLAGTDVEAIKHAHELLARGEQRLHAAAVPERAGAAVGGGRSPGDAAQPSDDEVADAEIVDDDQQSA